MLNEVFILKSANEYYRKFFSKKGLKMDLYPAMIQVIKLSEWKKLAEMLK